MTSKYARDEYERRFLLGADLPACCDRREIVDRYIEGTRLRLRNLGGTLKLAKIEDLAPGHKKLTNIYLTEAEAAVFRTLRAKEVRKTRYTVVHRGKSWSIDEFESGLRIAEVEHQRGEKIDLPDWCGEEITGRAEYSGWSLSQ
jgi:CYTH domain-containing protein